jgi:GLTT repeat (6 copies)
MLRNYCGGIAIGLALIGLASPAIAQVTINSTGVVAGTVTPPNKNPNFNQGTTRIDTDRQGRYFRNGQLIFNAQDVNPNLVGVDPNGRYYVDFRGIPVVSVDGSLTSTILDGQLTAIQRFNHNVPVKFWGNIQDEFVVIGQFTGTATDPATGNQYQGTFDIRGQGPRYSATNGGTSPTVFDFKSYYNLKANPAIPGQPTVTSYGVQAMPVQLRVTVPAGVQPIGNTPVITPIGATPTNPGNNPGLSSPGLSSPDLSSPGLSSPSLNSPGLSSQSESAIAATILVSPQSFALNRVVLSPPKARPIGPRSRIIIR